MTEDKEEKMPVSLGQVPTQYGLVYNTPQGELSQEDYLVWMGNLLVEIKESIKG